MNDSPDHLSQPGHRKYQEYEDPYFHDEDEVVPVEDGSHNEKTTLPGKKTTRRPLPRRRYYED